MRPSSVQLVAAIWIAFLRFGNPLRVETAIEIETGSTIQSLSSPGR